jgi:hypothetical protein
VQKIPPPKPVRKERIINWNQYNSIEKGSVRAQFAIVIASGEHGGRRKGMIAAWSPRQNNKPARRFAPSFVYGSPFPFTGTIVRVVVGISEATFEDLAAQHEARSRLAETRNVPCIVKSNFVDTSMTCPPCFPESKSQGVTAAKPPAAAIANEM